MSEQEPVKRVDARRVAHALAAWALIATGVATLLGFAGRLWWLFDLCSHFRVQYAVILLVTALGLAALRKGRWALGALALLLFNAAPIASLFWGQNAEIDAQRPTLDLVVFNVNFANTNYSQVAGYLAHADADVVIVIEATHDMRSALEQALVGYQSVGQARADAFGMLVFSRLPMSSPQVLTLSDGPLPSIALSLEKGGEHFSILGLHTMPPMGASNASLRDAMMAGAARWARRSDHAIIAGDFNATPWSYTFRDLLEAGRLHNSQRGFGLQTSWPGGLWPMSITIDHCLHDDSLRTADRFVGPFLGSDHRPLHLRIGFGSTP